MIAKSRFSISFITLLTSSFFSYAQIKGKIVDETNSPLEYASVAIYNQNTHELVTGGVTNKDGVFLFESLKKGSYYLQSSFIGYEVKTLRDIVITNASSTLDIGSIQLILGNTLNEIIIEGEKRTVVNKIDRQVFNVDYFKNAQGGSSIDIIKNLPSISIDGQGEITVRGSSGFVVLLNGKPTQGNAISLMAQLPANFISRVEIITAPSAKYDPEGKAGIINIITKKGVIKGAFGQINLKNGLPSIEPYENDKTHNRYGIDALYNIQNEKWNISLSANFQRHDIGGKRVGTVYTIINDIKTQTQSEGERSFDEKNYSGRFTLDFTPDSTKVFSLGVFAGKRSKDRLADIVYFDNHAVSPANSNNRLYTFSYFNHNLRERKSDFALASFDYNQTFNNQSKLSTSLFYEYTLLGGPTVNQNLGFPNNSLVFQDEYNTNNNPLNGIRVQIDYSFKPFNIGVLETGYQYRNLNHIGDFLYERRTDADSDFVLVPEFSSEVNLKRRIHSLYAQLSGKNGKWDYTTGFRIELMNRTLELKDKANTLDETFLYNFTKLYPSALVNYKVNEKTNLKVAYSKRVERTTTFKMNPFPEREHSETLEQGDPELKPEFIDLLELGISKKTKGGTVIFATGYFKHVNNVVNRVNTVYNDSILNRIYSNVGNAKAIGLELGMQLNPTKNWRNFIGCNIYNYSINGTFDNSPVNSEASVYSVNLNSTFNFWKNASLQFNFNYLSNRITAQGSDSQFYSPNLSFQKSFLNNRLTTTLQWQNIDLGLLKTNEQRITTFRDNQFFTTTNYIYEVDMVLLNLSYTFKNGKNKSKFIDSEFGKREF